MEIVELIQIINQTYNTTVIFDDPIKCANREPNNDFLIYFTPMNEVERRKYKKSQNREMVSSTPEIHILNLPMRDFVNVYENDETGIFDETKKMIAPFLSDDISFDIIFTTFLFLHEVGHWMQFKKVGGNVFQYINIDIALEQENFNKVSTLIKQREERIRKGNTCVLTVKEKTLFRTYMLEYRNIPKEKEADQFAIDNMNLALELITHSK